MSVSTTPASDRYARLVPGATAIAVLAAGCVVLLGWSTDNRTLTALSPGLVAMHPMTAVLLILASFSLWFFRRPEQRLLPRGIGQSCALCVLLVGCHQLAEHVLAWLLDGESLLDDVNVGGRLPLEPAFMFVLIGLALLMSQVERRWAKILTSALSLAAACMSSMALLSYLYRLAWLRGQNEDVPMSVNSSLCFVAFSLGLMCLHGNTGLLARVTSQYSGGLLVRRMLPATLLLPVALGWLALAGQTSGAFDTVAGVSLFVMAIMVTLTGLVVWVAHTLDRNDRLRRRAEQLSREHASLIEATNRELEAFAAEARAATGAKSAFLAMMSHEIRTPLNGIIGFADLLRRNAESGEAERQEWLEIIGASGKHLLALINDILDLSKIDAGKLKIEEVECSPVTIIHEVCSILRSKADEKGLALEAVFDGPIPRTIHTDPTRLRQVIINLVGNSIKFTNQGHVRITTRLRRPNPSCGTGAALEIDVADTGIGIPADKLGTVFDPFTQADSSITRQFGGTGLGLPISRRLAEHLGGGISVRSEVGKGTTFTCTIATGCLDGVPLVENVHTIAASSEPVRQPAIQSDSVLHKRVLVVDDSETNRKLIHLMLGRAGAHVEEAENGKQGVEQALAEPFDLILMDMQMPVMDGYTATKELRARGVSIPIVALTASAMKGDADICREAGCSGYLAKPVDLDILLTTVQAFLCGARASSSADSRATSAASASLNGSHSGEKLVSTLPMDDDDFRAIVAEFIERVGEKVGAMHAAAAAQNLPEVAALAHWLRGTGGSAGFPAFVEPAETLEHHARRGQAADTLELIDRIEQLAARLSLD